ncbi:MAG TPA: hypothetical protein VGD60_14870 [Candidatus Acidoferrales bacterium]
MNTRFLVLVCLGGLVVASVGCGHKSAKAAPPVASAPEPSLADSKPLTTIAPDTNATPPLENVPAPPNPAPTSTPSLPVSPAHTKPAPPARKPATDTSAESASEQAPARPAAPQISPQISPGDQAALQHKTGDDLNIAQHNLQQSSGRQLSAAQHDLVEKIMSFMAQSNEAGKTGDWARAQNLSQKARLLSQELVESL